MDLNIELWCAEGSANDTFIQLTEGVMPAEDLATAQHHPLSAADVTEHPGRTTIEWTPPPGMFRAGVSWPAAWGEHFTGLGARHCLPFDQSGRSVRLGADRRYTGPDCPPEMLDVGGIPQGDYVPVPWLVSDQGYSLWLETLGDGGLFELGFRPIGVASRVAAGPFRLRVFTGPSPVARLRRFLGLTGLPALLPEWAYGHWKSR